MPLNNRAVAQQCSSVTSQIDFVPQITEGREESSNSLVPPNSPNQVVQGHHGFSEAIGTWVFSVSRGE